MIYQTMKEIYPEYKTNNYFLSGLTEKTDLNGIFSDDDLLTDFFTRHGDKIAAPINTIWRDRVQQLIIGHFKEKWKRYVGVYNSTYEAIENYDRYEEWNDGEVGSDKKTGTDTNETSGTGTDNTNLTSTKGTKNELTHSGDLVENHDLATNSEKYGINNNVGHPDTKQSDTGKITTTDGRVETTSVSGTDIDETKVSRQKSETLKMIYDNLNTMQRNSSHKGHIHGNIGVTTSQQMLQSELELWKWDFLATISDDIASLLTLPIY